MYPSLDAAMSVCCLRPRTGLQCNNYCVLEFFTAQVLLIFLK